MNLEYFVPIPNCEHSHSSTAQSSSSVSNKNFMFNGSDIDACDENLRNDESKWDNVRKGICCLCCNSSIDALMYRYKYEHPCPFISRASDDSLLSSLRDGSSFPFSVILVV